MKLRNKKTGGTGYVLNSCDGKTLCVCEEESSRNNIVKEYRNLAELNEEWEDAPDELKPFEEVAEIKFECIAPWTSPVVEKIQIADQDYYEILPDGTKKTEFTWDEAMEIEKKTHGKWRVPTVPEIFAICAAFGRSEDGTDVDPQVLKETLGLDGSYGLYWSAATYDTYSSRGLYFYASYLSPRSGNSKGYGFAVRCVASSV